MLGSLEIREIHTGQNQQDNGLGSDLGKLIGMKVMAETWKNMSAMVLSHLYSLLLNVSYRTMSEMVG